MGRALRCQEPGTFYFVTTRCLESRFFLRPDPEIRALCGLWLARALARVSGITLYGAVAMSNHLHLLVLDANGTLPCFMCYFLGNLARAVNQLRARSGAFFHRRYDATRLLDPRAAVRYLAYLISNPVNARLVARHEEWPGLLLYARSRPWQAEFLWVDRESLRRATRLAESVGKPRPPRSDFEQRGTLTVQPLPFTCDEDTLTLLGGRGLLSLDPQSRAFVSRIASTPLHAGAVTAGDRFLSAGQTALDLAREAERTLQAARGRRPLGANAVLAQSPFATPFKSDDCARPLVLCEASAASLWHVFRRAWRVFREWYQDAAESFRAGNLHAQFPPFSLRPGGLPAASILITHP